MKRGTILWMNLEGATPPAFVKMRPAIIVSNSEQNALLETVVVIPLSTQAPEVWPLRLKLEMPDQKTSYVVLPGIRQAKKARLLDVIEIAPAEFMHRLDRALSAYLAD
jgi:mRNA-degrading endonuclease toxin of MazEF toxin-antitoxin module